MFEKVQDFVDSHEPVAKVLDLLNLTALVSAIYGLLPYGTVVLTFVYIALRVYNERLKTKKLKRELDLL